MNRLLIRTSPAAGSLHTAITETPPTTARAGGGRGEAAEGRLTTEAFEEKFQQCGQNVVMEVWWSDASDLQHTLTKKRNPTYIQITLNLYERPAMGFP